MNAVSVLSAGVSGVALAIAALYGTLWLLDRPAVANLAFCVVAIGVAGLSIAQLGMMHSASPAEYGEWVRWFHVPNFLAVAGLVVFVHLLFRSRRLWLSGAVVGLRLGFLRVQFFGGPDLH